MFRVCRIQLKLLLTSGKNKLDCLILSRHTWLKTYIFCRNVLKLSQSYTKDCLKRKWNVMIDRQQTAQRARATDEVVKHTQSYLRSKMCASVRHLAKKGKVCGSILASFSSPQTSCPADQRHCQNYANNSRECALLTMHLLLRVKLMMQTVSNRIFL